MKPVLLLMWLVITNVIIILRQDKSRRVTILDCQDYIKNVC